MIQVFRVVSVDREHREYRVVRTDKDISALYTGLQDKFLACGCIVPPPPSPRSQVMARYARINRIGADRGENSGELWLQYKVD